MNTFLPQKFPTYLSIKITPNKPTTKITGIMNDGTLKIELKAIPEKGKANKEIIKFFRKNFGLTTTIKTGNTQRKKLIYLEKE